MFSVRKFRELLPYQKALDILRCLSVEKLTAEEINDIRFSTTKICGYIAQSEGCRSYPKEAKYKLSKALEWTSTLEKKIKELNISDVKKQQYRAEINQIRRILITLRKKVGGQSNGKFI